MNFKALHIKWMQKALWLARQASKQGEVPVGAILVKNHRQVVGASNASIQMNDPTAHAEMLVLRKAATLLKTPHLYHTTLYTTLEPCLMCLGAIIQLQVPQVIFGAYDAKQGAAGSRFEALQLSEMSWQPDLLGGFCEQESCQLLRNFFQQQRGKMPSI